MGTYYLPWIKLWFMSVCILKSATLDVLTVQTRVRWVISASLPYTELVRGHEEELMPSLSCWDKDTSNDIQTGHTKLLVCLFPGTSQYMVCKVRFLSVWSFRLFWLVMLQEVGICCSIVFIATTAAEKSQTMHAWPLKLVKIHPN